MAQRHIGPVSPERDELGFWTHPALLRWNLETAAQITWWLRSHELECWVMCMRDEAPELCLASADDEHWNAQEWIPEPPPGEGWFLGSIHDPGDGPVCFWLRIRHD